MGEHTEIGWCDGTFSPWWGCIKVSPGCQHCYAEDLAHRYRYPVFGPAATTSRRVFGEEHWKEPRKWNMAAEKKGIRMRVFCSSMADVFEDHPDLPPERAKLWPLIEETPYLDWQLLTKRPENISRMVPERWMAGGFPAHVQIGTSCENQKWADIRITELIKIPARIHFLSCEPLLGLIDLHDWFKDDPKFVSWVIVGGESGREARTMHLSWAIYLRAQCWEYNTPCFMKQLGSVWAKQAGATQGKGEDLEEWPDIDLWVREFPKGVGQLPLFPDANEQGKERDVTYQIRGG